SLQVFITRISDCIKISGLLARSLLVSERAISKTSDRFMKLTKYLLAIAALTVALTLSAKADLVDLGGVAFQGGPGGNSPAANLAALEASGVDTTGFVLCGNSDNGEFGNPITNPITVMAGAFLVVHYGTGEGGSNPGGQLEFLQVVNGETSVDVPVT